MDLPATTRRTAASLIALVGCLLLLIAQAAASSGSEARKVNGEVLAVNTYDSPNTIVLRTYTGTQEELIVGATVEADVNIQRGNQVVNLDEIRVGEQVKLTYVKTLEGLVARAIHAR